MRWNWPAKSWKASWIIQHAIQTIKLPFTLLSLSYLELQKFTISKIFWKVALKFCFFQIRISYCTPATWPLIRPWIRLYCWALLSLLSASPPLVFSTLFLRTRTPTIRTRAPRKNSSPRRPRTLPRPRKSRRVSGTLVRMLFPGKVHEVTNKFQIKNKKHQRKKPKPSQKLRKSPPSPSKLSSQSKSPSPSRRKNLPNPPQLSPSPLPRPPPPLHQLKSLTKTIWSFQLVKFLMKRLKILSLPLSRNLAVAFQKAQKSPLHLMLTT